MNIQGRLQKLEHAQRQQGDRCACSAIETRYLRGAENSIPTAELPPVVCEHCGLEKLTIWMHTAGSGLTDDEIDAMEAWGWQRWRPNDEHSNPIDEA